MKSMTGYGTSRAELNGLDLEVSVRSVNGRYLDVRTHLPKDFISMESAVKELAKKSFRRGTVDIFVQIPLASADSLVGVLDTDVARRWMERVKTLKTELKIPGDLSLEALVGLPGVLKTGKNFSLSVEDGAKLLKACQVGIQACQDFRLREGKEIFRLIKGHLQGLLKIVKQIETLQGKFEAALIKKFKNEIKAFPDEEAQTQLETKVNETLEKVNIKEETSRLAQHLRAAEVLLSDKDSVGKKLDFFAQEFLREMNTIGSKCQSAEITQVVIQGKSAIESFREQVQNIE